MKRIPPLLWPLLVGALALLVTALLWRHERQMEDAHLRNTFEFGLRQTATRVEQRMASYEQMLRGTRGLFEASDTVTPEDFDTYVDTLMAGPDFAGLRAIAFAPAVGMDAATGTPTSAPITYLAPRNGLMLNRLGDDLIAEAVRRTALLQARDSGRLTITQALRLPATQGGGTDSGFLLSLPIYRSGAGDTVQARRQRLVGWVLAGFHVGDLMSSLYGEGAPGLDVSIYDGVDVGPERLMFGPPAAAIAAKARFEAQEYLGFAGHAWTLLVRSTPAFERRYSSDSAPIIAASGSVLSLLLALVTWQLVTGRERAAATARGMTEQLRDSAQRYRRIVETANEGIWMVDAQACTTFVNPKLQRMLGVEGEDLVGRPWADFMDEAGRTALAGDAQPPLPAGPTEQCEVRFRRRDGGELWATVSTSPILDDAGRPAGALAMVTDSTERRLAEVRRTQLEGQLRQSQKMEAIGTLAGGIAHDFNNILAAILGNVSLMRQELPDGHPALLRLGQIGRAGERARSLVQQIVAFSRQQPQERVVQPLRPLLEESVRLLRSTLPALVEIELQLGDEPLEASTDATQLQQVLMNLCTNAWHAMPSGSGRIVVGLHRVQLDAEAADRVGPLPAGPYAHLQVSDNGVGMDEATLQRIFEPFFTTKPVGKGTGLGLAVVHGIVSSHGGAISVRSQPGAGSTFDLYLPLVLPVERPVAAPADVPATPAGHGQHVLYIDDDPVMGLMVEGLLQRAGYRVTCIDDPQQALRRATAADDPVDLVVSDFNMPELSGLDVARTLARVRPALPVIITSGFVSDALRLDALRAGVRHVLEKEYTLEQLGALVHATLPRPLADGAAGAAH